MINCVYPLSVVQRNGHVSDFIENQDLSLIQQMTLSECLVSQDVDKGSLCSHKG